jgi:hypothetical protein
LAGDRFKGALGEERPIESRAFGGSSKEVVLQELRRLQDEKLMGPALLGGPDEERGSDEERLGR